MKIYDIINEWDSGVKRVNTGIDMKAALAKRAAQISSPGTNPTLSTRTNVTRNSNSGTGTTHKTFSKYTQKMGDLGGTSLSKVNNIRTSATGATGTSTKRFVRPGGAGTQSVTNVGTGKTTNTNFQLKGPQSWAYDKPKPKLNASKKIKEDGVIVPGVNTTVDVKPGETERQAAKFGNGKIKPLMPKRGKSQTINTLYNMGLAESKKKDKPEDIEGIDPATQMAVKKLQAKYPHADNVMSAMLAATQEIDKMQDKADRKLSDADTRHNRKFQELEKKLLDLIKKNNLKA